MIPVLDQQPDIDQLTLDFLNTVYAEGFEGDIHTDYASRLVMATDNSIYQILPQAVIYPKNAADIQKIFRISSKEEFSEVAFSARGGGTGTNGQSLNRGIMLDVSRHMTNILEYNEEESWVRLQPGVVLDQLNSWLKPMGVFFAPTLSTSNRATMGGMVSTDASGKGSKIYGKTSNHVHSIQAVLTDGSILDSSVLSYDQLGEHKQRKDMTGHIFRTVDQIVKDKKEVIQKNFPKLDRYLTGYDLAHLYKENGDFDLSSILCGSEGTLATLTELKLKVIPLPKFKKLIVIKYASFDEALRAARVLASVEPAAIETGDEKILKLAKDDAVWHKVGHLLGEDGDTPTKTINFVEFVGDDEAELEEKISQLVEKLEELMNQPGEAIGYYLCKDDQEIAAFWELRKKGVGLLGNTPGNRRPLAFVEDTAVPPENLADYIKEFRELLEKHGLDYGMFGHVDVGCLHVRPALDMKEPEDEKLIRTISDGVMYLCKKYGGVIWGEHGKGFRAEYVKDFFGDEIYAELRKVKSAFDPKNQLNPGKIVTPIGMESMVPNLDKLEIRGQYDRTIPVDIRSDFEETINCNGNAACLNYNPDDVMCPSSKYTKDRVNSPKGRAGIMREWLRLLSERGFTEKGFQHVVGQGIEKGVADGKKPKKYDFSHEVYEAMMGCLSCKACATQCPIKVDVPEFKARFLELYHTRYQRPLKDFMVGNVEWLAPLQAKLPGISNLLQSNSIAKAWMKKRGGMVNAPLLSQEPLKKQLKLKNAPEFDISVIDQLSESEKEKSVILLQDAFTSFYEAHLVVDLYELLSELGFRVFVLPFRPNGKPLHVKGFLQRFKQVAEDNTVYYRSLAKLGVPMIGLEPSVTLTYRDEYPRALKLSKIGFEVQLVQEWLVNQLNQEMVQEALKEVSKEIKTFKLLSHCTEKTAVAGAPAQWKQIFEAFGAELNTPATGCCGMAGTFGHETDHLEESKGIYEMSWKKQIPDAQDERKYVLATGYSCRSQVKRFDGFIPKHPVQALLELL